MAGPTFPATRAEPRAHACVLEQPPGQVGLRHRGRDVRKARGRQRVRASGARDQGRRWRALRPDAARRYILAGAAYAVRAVAHARLRRSDANTTGASRPRSSSTLRGTAPRHTWVAGIAVDWFAIRTPRTAPVRVRPHAGRHLRPRRRAGRAVVDGLGQRPPRLHKRRRGCGSLLLSPRGSALVHGGPWAARFSAGRSYFAPTPLTEETEAAGFTRLTIDGPLELETAHSVSADFDAHDPLLRRCGHGVSHAGQSSRAGRPRDLHAPHRHRARRHARRRDPRHGAPGAVRGDRHLRVLRARERGDLEVALTPRHSAG